MYNISQNEREKIFLLSQKAKTASLLQKLAQVIIVIIIVL